MQNTLVALRIKEAAEAMGYSTDILMCYIQRKKCKTVEVNGEMLIPMSEVDRVVTLKKRHAVPVCIAR